MMLGGALSATFAIAAPLATADGLYIGAGAYKTDMDIQGFDDDDNTPAAFVGYQFLDTNLLMLSAELGYYDLGDYSGANFSVDAKAYTAAGVVYLPVGPFFEIYGKLGIASVEVDTRVNGIKKSYDGEEAFGGIGFAFDLLDTVDIYAEYLQFDNEVESEMIGVGVRFDFF
jgi:opacity protein-like surface antigen